ncbi:MAG: hypothetical protein KA158_09715 [Leucobacter sp.]|nr:hypothetical protein [Leucobacter sp.]
MNAQDSAALLRQDYLSGLDAAIAELPHGLAVELRAGITEELSGLEGDALERRISALGSPESVAQAALEMSPSAQFAGAPVPAAHILPPQQATVVAPEPLPINETRGYAIAAVIVLGIGGIVLPVIGWVVGCVLVFTSKLWRVSEKLWAALFPAVVIAVGVLVSLLGRALTTAESGPITLSGRYYDPTTADPTANPLLPAFYDSFYSTFFLGVFVVTPLTAVWLLTRLRGRRSAEDTASKRGRTEADRTA